MRRIMAEWARFENHYSKLDGGLWVFVWFWLYLLFFESGRNKLSAEECWIFHSFLFLPGEMGPELWVKHHLSWLCSLLWEWNSTGIKVQHKFDFHCSPKLCLSCICQDGVWNSSEYKKREFSSISEITMWSVAFTSGFPASPSLETWVFNILNCHLSWRRTPIMQPSTPSRARCQLAGTKRFISSHLVYVHSDSTLLKWVVSDFCWGNKRE